MRTDRRVSAAPCWLGCISNLRLHFLFAVQAFAAALNQHGLFYRTVGWKPAWTFILPAATGSGLWHHIVHLSQHGHKRRQEESKLQEAPQNHTGQSLGPQNRPAFLNSEAEGSLQAGPGVSVPIPDPVGP